ncbi:hypothetical protein Psta_0918 [Pirellula staleyi DSM 6068]|uniref:Uncharacterized protein n=1 Tax=Pirellula staleyi (strain ATCC 27377 / DSM 6068 / ICPB 4128) TaxID=530564 RepID=D2R7A7_PIRSD|nr:hypothetical protein [Pirellula staleyi]ADB15603.1 hypothetical protein Psta_0918 [Pirellula staleyi DSM 6068]
MSDQKNQVLKTETKPRIASLREIAVILVLWLIGTIVAISVSGAIQKAINLRVLEHRWAHLALYVPILTMFTSASLYFAFSRYLLLLRFAAAILMACLAIFCGELLFYIENGRIIFSEPLNRAFMAIFVIVIGSGVFLSMVRFTGWHVRHITMPPTPGNQFSISGLLQVTLICAVGLGVGGGLRLEQDDLLVLGINVASIIGLTIAVAFLMIDNWSAKSRAISTFIAVLLLLILLGLISARLFHSSNFETGGVRVVFEVYLLAFNTLAMICYVLRARGYRLTQQTVAMKT